MLISQVVGIICIGASLIFYTLSNFRVLFILEKISDYDAICDRVNNSAILFAVLAVAFFIGKF